MKFKALVLVVTILSLVNCDSSPTSRPIANPQGSSGGAAVAGAGSKGRGTGSGGGGYDLEAKQGIKITQKFLTKMLQNSNEIIFEEFPSEFKKAELIEIINNVKFIDDYPVRDGEKLLFDYKLETNQLYYTKQFVDKYGQYKFSNSAEDDLKNIKEYASLIMHELSHLMGLGNNKDKDIISALFSKTFLNHMLTETQICEGINQDVPFSIVLNPQTGMSFLFQNTEIIDFKGVGHQEISENTLLQSESWMLGQVFPFFELKGDTANAAVSLSVAEFEPPGFGVDDLSAFDIIEFLDEPNLIENKTIVFWNFDQDIATYEYSMNYLNFETTENSSIGLENETIKEKGSINFSKNFSNINEQKLEVTVMHNDTLNSDLSASVQLNCENFVKPYEFKALSALNAKNITGLELETELNKVSQSMVINNLIKMQGCENPINNKQKTLCAAYNNL